MVAVLPAWPKENLDKQKSPPKCRHCYWTLITVVIFFTQNLRGNLMMVNSKFSNSVNPNMDKPCGSIISNTKNSISK